MSRCEVSMCTKDAVLRSFFRTFLTTSRRCLLRLRRGIVCCNALSDIYLRKPTKSEGCNIVTLHKDVHNIPGMMGSLDVTRVHWKNCSTAWKRQFQGRETFADIGLEEVVDHNLWFWHAEFGFPETLNDINVWECSSLFESMTNGEHKKLDFDFLVDSEVFSKLFNLVDGIYPPMTCFIHPSQIHTPKWHSVSPVIKNVFRRRSREDLVYWSWNFRHCFISTCTVKTTYTVWFWLQF